MAEMKTYLGDGVYCKVTDGMLELTTEDGFGPLNVIFLEPEVMEALIAFYDRAKKKAAESRGEPNG